MHSKFMTFQCSSQNCKSLRICISDLKYIVNVNIKHTNYALHYYNVII